MTVDFLCIGSQKAGTTWLHANLIEHPGVWMPFLKEVHHFDSRFHEQGLNAARSRIVRKVKEQIARARQKKPKDKAAIQYFRGCKNPEKIFSDEWYGHLFSPAPPGAKKGEITPAYSTLPDAGLDDLKAATPGAKIIYLIRDPHNRTLSAIRMLAHRRKFDKITKDQQDEEIRAYFGRERYVVAGDYADLVPRWDARYTEGADILYLPFGHIKTDPAGLLRKIEDFLGLEPFTGYPTLASQVHAGKPYDPPDWARQQSEERAGPHRAFLKERFGEAFALATY